MRVVDTPRVDGGTFGREKDWVTDRRGHIGLIFFFCLSYRADILLLADI
jgi:hypothetical protein